MEGEVAPGSPITIVIVIADDHQVVRAGLRLLLEAEEGFEVLAEAGDVPTTEHTLNAYRPRVLILDLTMAGESSLSAIPRMRATSPGTQIVVLTMHSDPALAREAMRAGAAGYVLKEAADTELVRAVRLAAQGRTYLNPQLGARLAAKSPGAAGPPDELTAREVEVLRLIALGHTNSEIAAALDLSVRTIESHRAHIQQKTRLTTRARPGRLRARPRSALALGGQPAPARVTEPRVSRAASETRRHVYCLTGGGELTCLFDLGASGDAAVSHRAVLGLARGFATSARRAFGGSPPRSSAGGRVLAAGDASMPGS
jgi:two-component system response regulator NreC